MCGIFGYIGKKENPVTIVIDGLRRLEYRGYDSAGIAGVHHGAIVESKEVGKVSVLEREVKDKHLVMDVAIAHTRWATHGAPTVINAHPQFDEKKTLAVVHNGIIENFQSLRENLQKKGVKFVSETDTEVIAQLIAHFYKGDLLAAVKETVPLLHGAFAVALIHKDHPDQIIAIAHESPMVIGIGDGQAFISSDANAFAPHTRQVVYLSNSEVAVVRADKLEILNSSMEPITKAAEQLSHEVTDASKGQYEHYTLKEIFEQPQTLRNAMANRFVEEYGTAMFEGLIPFGGELHDLKRILILACGTSWHAGFVASYMIEDLARIPVQVEISSEFRYKNPIVQPNTLVIAISQSGETADTLAAVRELKAKGARVFGICNVQGSSLAREADFTIFLHAGPEIGVCSTKAFTSQVVVLYLFTILLSRMRNMSREEGQGYLEALKQLPDIAKRILELAPNIQEIAKRYARYDNFFFLGRLHQYPAALEGALKLKEISYINANGYPAGEMKHGPIALIGSECPTVALCANKKTYDKMLSNLMEVKARKGPIIAIAEEGQQGLEGIADEIILIPESLDELSAITTTLVTQLLAYYVALERGEDIDQPRNLAKSVTVE